MNIDLTKISKEERQQLFINELKDLLTKFDVELDVEYETGRYGVEEYILYANFNGKSIGNEYVEYSDLKIGKWIKGNK